VHFEISCHRSNSTELGNKINVLIVMHVRKKVQNKQFVSRVRNTKTYTYTIHRYTQTRIQWYIVCHYATNNLL